MVKRLTKFSVVIDSNEYHVARTWVFPDHITHVQPLIKYGCDYSIRGQVGVIGVERKAYGDYVGCVGHGWKRFQKQLAKLKKNKYFCVIVDGHIDDPIPHQSRMIHSAVLLRTAQVTLMGVPVLFAGTRAKAVELCVKFFQESLKKVQDAV